MKKAQVQKGQRRNSKESMWASLQKDARIDENNCWLIVNRYLDKNGYSQVMVNRVTIKSHRLAFEMTHGYITNELVMHSCDPPNCINPDHLYLGSYKDNVEDMAEKRRSAFGVRNSQAKLSVEVALELFNRTDKTVRELAQEYGLGESTIHQLKSGRTWSQVTGLTKIEKPLPKPKDYKTSLSPALYNLLFGRN